MVCSCEMPVLRANKKLQKLSKQCNEISPPNAVAPLCHHYDLSPSHSTNSHSWRANIYITVVCGRALQISVLISSWQTNSSKRLQKNKAFLMQHQWVAESFGQKRERRMTNNRHTLSIASNSTKAQASSTGNSTNTGNGNAAVVSEGSSDPKRSDNGKTKAAQGLTKRELRGLLAYHRAGHSRVQVVKQLRYKYLKGCLAVPRIQIVGKFGLEYH